MDFSLDTSSQGGTFFPPLGVYDGVIYSNVLSNNLRNELPITTGILTTKSLTASSNVSIVGKLTQTNIACNVYIAGNVGIGYSDNSILNSNFNINGTSYFNSNVNILGSLTQTGTSNITFNGSTTVNNTLAIAGLLTQTIGGTVSLSGKTTINSNLVISGNNILYATGKVGIGYTDNAILNSNFNVNGTSYFSSNVLFNGNIGIGITNPNTSLEIYNATNPKIYLNTAGTTRCFISGLSPGLDLGNDVGTGKYIRFMPDNTERMRIDSNGNVGIGTNNPQNLLDVRGATNILLTTVGLPGIGTYGSGGGYRLILYVGSDTLHPYGLGINSGTLWYSCPTGTRHEFYIGSTRTLYMNSTDIQTGNSITMNGQNGISQQLLITSSTLTTDDCSMRLTAAGSIQLIMGVGGSTNTNVLTRSNAYIISSGNMIFMTNNRTVFPNLVINTSGNVGIGTDTANNILQVGNAGRLRISNGDTDYSIIGTVDINTNSTNTKIFLSGSNCTTAGFAGGIQYFATSTGGHAFYAGLTERMRIINNGNVGIGTDNPTNILQIGNAGRLKIGSIFDYTLIGTADIDGTTNTRIVISGNQRVTPYTGNIDYITTSNGNHIFYTNGINEKMRLDTNGNLNINGELTTPTITNITNFVLTEERQYPPKIYDSISSLSQTSFLNITAYSQSITVNSYTNGYGIGTYTVYASSATTSNVQNFANLLNHNTSDAIFFKEWEYNGSSIYIGSNYIEKNYKGDWFVIKFPYSIVLTRYIIYARTNAYDTYDTAPGLWKCYGSNDGINFIEIPEASNIINIAVSFPSGYFEFTVNSSFNIPYLYIGFCVNSLTWSYYGRSFVLAFTEIKIFGKELINKNIYNYLSSNILPNYSTNVYDTNEKRFPPRLYNYASSETTTATEILNCIPATVYKQTLTLNNHGIYTIYSSSSTNTAIYAKDKLFNFNTLVAIDAGGHWADSRYDPSTGNYTYTPASYIKSDYLGDWIIIKLPYKIILSRFKIYARSQLFTRAPSLWKCYGSNDGISFTEITEASISVAVTLNSYNLTAGIYEQLLPYTFNKSYLYIGFTFNKIIGGTDGILNFSELILYGLDYVYSKTLNDWTKSGNDIYMNSIGNIGIGTTNPKNKLHITGNNPAIIRIETDTSDVNLISGIEFGIPAFDSSNCAKILSTTVAGDKNILQFYTASTTNLSTEKMRISDNGNVGIGNAITPTAKLHIEHSSTTTMGSGGGLYVFNPTNAANNSSVISTRIGGNLANKALYSLDVNGYYGWSIYINGNDTTDRILRFNNGWDGSATDRLTIKYDGTTTINGSLTATSFTGNGANITNVPYSTITGAPSIYTQTQSDGRYLQLSGGTMTGSINMTNASTYLNFGTRVEDFLIKLYADSYGFGINAAALRYNAASSASHKFYSGSTNTVIIDSVGNMLVGNSNVIPHIQLGSTNGHNLGVATAAGNFSSSASAGDMVLRSINKLILQSGSGGHSLIINTDNSISCSGALTLPNAIWSIKSADNVNRINYATNGATYFKSGNSSGNSFIFKNNVDTTEILTISNSGDLTLSGALNLTGVASGNNPLYISSTNTTANNCIQIKNNLTYFAYIGLGGSGFGGNYANNVFIESASSSIILNTNGRNSGTVPNFIVHSSGNIGIGITTPDSKLHIETPDNTGITTNLLNFKNTSGYGIYTTSTSISNRGNTLDFLARDYNTTGGANITNRNLLSLSPDGNVGIGITNPFASLCIGTPAINGSDGALVISKRSSAGNRNFKLAFDGNYNFCIGDFSGAVSGNTWSSNQLSIGWEYGNVGIGTSGQSQKLYVNGSSYFNDTLTVGSAVVPNQKYGYIGGLRIGGFDGNTLYNETRAIGITALNDIMLATGTSLADYTPRLIVKANGNIGIGTTSPQVILHLYTTSHTLLYIDASAGTGQSGLRLIAGNGTTNRATRIDFYNNVTSTSVARWTILNDYFQNGTNDLQIINGSGNNVFTILQNNNIGIGTTNPYSLLHIKGTNPALTIMGQGNTGATSQLNLSTYDTTSNVPNCSLIATDSGSYGATFQIKQKTPGADSNSQFTSLYIDNNGTIGIGKTNPSPRCILDIKGVVNITNNNPYAVPNNTFQPGSLIIGDTLLNYGGGTSWNGSTAGLMMECADNTEIAVHDAGTRLASLMYYEGGGNNKITIGRDMYWGTISSVILNGNIGIGTNSPVTLLEVASKSYSSTATNYRLFNYATAITTSNTSFNDCCSKFNGSIWVTSWIASSSDYRIKCNIQDINDDNALQMILKIQPKTYNYIDVYDKGADKVYGFIAQQIKDVIPEAVTIEKSLIPNIYSLYECSSNVINIKETSNLEKLKINDTISIIQENKGSKNYIITDINTETNEIKIDSNLEDTKCFVYGTEVNDFHTLDKNYIFTLNVCATQELYRQIQEQKTLIQNLQMQINEIKQMINK